MSIHHEMKAAANKKRTDEIYKEIATNIASWLGVMLAHGSEIKAIRQHIVNNQAYYTNTSAAEVAKIDRFLGSMSQLLKTAMMAVPNDVPPFDKPQDIAPSLTTALNRLENMYPGINRELQQVADAITDAPKNP